MKTIKVLFSICCLMVYNVSTAQTIFSEQYNISTCNIVGLGSGGNIQCTSLSASTYPFAPPFSAIYDVLEYNALRGDQEIRFQKNIGTTLDENDAWAASFDFQIKPLNSGQYNYGAVLFALNDETDHFRERHPNFPATGGSDPNSNASSISVWLGDALSTGQNDVYLFIRGKINGTWLSASDKIYLSSFNSNQSTPNKYEITVTRQNKAVFHLKVKDLSNSAVQELCYDATGKDANNNDIFINGLEYLQQGASSTASTSRTLNGYIDNLLIESISGSSCASCATCDITNELMVNQNSLNSCQYDFNWTATVGSQNHFAGSVLNYGDGYFDETRNLIHNSSKQYYLPTPSAYKPTLSSFSYYFNQGFHCCSSYSSLSIDDNGPCSETTALEEDLINDPCEFQPNLGISTNGLTVTFTNISADPALTSTPYGYFTSALDFGDCSYQPDFEIGNSISHTYNAYGTYVVNLTMFGYQPGTGNQMDCCMGYINRTVTLSPINPPRIKSSIEKTFQFEVYPNPFKNEFKVSLEEGVTEIRVHNYVGKEIRRISTTGQTMLDLDFSNEATGIYIISAIKGEEVLTKKIIKQ